MNLSSEIIEFKARDLLKGASISVVESGNGYVVIDESFRMVQGPFETQGEAHHKLAEWWDEKVENSRTGFVALGRNYHGFKDEQKNPVVIYTVGEDHGETLSPEKSWAVINHSPVGLDWNNKDGGAAQLAFALLLEHYPERTARKYYHRFKKAVVWSLPGESWSLPEKEIRVWMEQSQLECIGNY